MSVCPLCRARKGKRACPAKQASICAACCGSKRRVEIDCPSHCGYLGGAHGAHWEGRETERRRDLRRLAPLVQDLSDSQAELFFLTLTGLSAIRRRTPELDDALFEDAVQALRRTVETRASGLVYEHPPQDARASSVVAELRGLFEARGEEGTALHPSDADLLPVLAALGAGLRQSRAAVAGPTAFLDSATRLAGTLAPAAAAADAPRLILG